jgi:hypothetical protein
MNQEPGPMTQRDQLIERSSAVLSKTVGVVVAKTVAKNSCKLACKTATRTASPLLLAADGAQFVTEFLMSQLGCENTTAELAGQGVGVCSSAVIGAAVGSVGGPPGAAAGAGIGVAVWAGGEVIAKGIGRLVKAISG